MLTRSRRAVGGSRSMGPASRSRSGSARRCGTSPRAAGMRSHQRWSQGPASRRGTSVQTLRMLPVSGAGLPRLGRVCARTSGLPTRRPARIRRRPGTRRPTGWLIGPPRERRTADDAVGTRPIAARAGPVFAGTTEFAAAAERPPHAGTADDCEIQIGHRRARNSSGLPHSSKAALESFAPYSRHRELQPLGQICIN